MRNINPGTKANNNWGTRRADNTSVLIWQNDILSLFAEKCEASSRLEVLVLNWFYNLGIVKHLERWEFTEQAVHRTQVIAHYSEILEFHTGWVMGVDKETVESATGHECLIAMELETVRALNQLVDMYMCCALCISWLEVIYWGECCSLLFFIIIYECNPYGQAKLHIHGRHPSHSIQNYMEWT